jgi:orotate phosphoribosyltransferase
MAAPATGDIAAARARFVEIIKARSFQKGAEIKLVSGKTSSFYFNMKPTMLDPEGAYLIGRLIVDALKGRQIAAVGGLEMGAVPIATAAAAASFAAGAPMKAFFVRKQAKDHGTQSLIEGLAPGESLAGKTVVVVEDVTTTGGSSMKAVEQLRLAGAKIDCVMTLVDREEGATANFQAEGLTFLPILTLADFR